MGDKVVAFDQSRRKERSQEKSSEMPHRPFYKPETITDTTDTNALKVTSILGSIEHRAYDFENPNKDFFNVWKDKFMTFYSGVAISYISNVQDDIGENEELDRYLRNYLESVGEYFLGFYESIFFMNERGTRISNHNFLDSPKSDKLLKAEILLYKFLLKGDYNLSIEDFLEDDGCIDDLNDLLIAYSKVHMKGRENQLVFDTITLHGSYIMASFLYFDGSIDLIELSNRFSLLKNHKDCNLNRV
ncbi:MAG: hypothetical protein PHS92_04810 [Candidatus Gracilibacteria bacterium]|nr:hypothetical protein [Candidatus Gracilibacteria bacterium]